MDKPCPYLNIFIINILIFIILSFLLNYSKAFPRPIGNNLMNTVLSPRIRPNFNRMNVSQDEYTKMFNIYFRRIQNPSSYQSKQLFTFFNSAGIDVGRLHSRTSLVFKTNLSQPQVETATLRMLVDEAIHLKSKKINDNKFTIKIYERLFDGKRMMISSTKIYNDMLPKWTDIDLERASLEGDLRFEIECASCRLRISSPTLNAVVVHSDINFRRKRQALHSHSRKTDCYPGAKKRRCCRHTMDVVFKELPGYEFVIQPYGFDAGYCKGACPYRYNPANHHSSLQSLIWRQKKGGAPKPCCAPSKLDKLEILHLDESDNTKLKVASWSNMMVLECACF